jgi:hypothetical protein
MGWIVVTYKLGADTSRARVAVWRETRRSGALHLQQSVVAFPDLDTFQPAVQRFRALIEEVGGESLALQSEPLGGPDETHLTQAWNQARDAEYAELRDKCAKFLIEIEHEFEIEKFTHAELEEEEAELDKLQRWHHRITARDVHQAAAGPATREALTEAEAALARYSQAVFERSAP